MEMIERGFIELESSFLDSDASVSDGVFVPMCILNI